MSIYFGPLDPMQLQFNILNQLMIKGILSADEVKKILKNSLDPKLPEDEKREILDSLMKLPHA